MNKERITEVVNGYIVNRVTEMIEDMSSQDFLERISDMIEEEGIEVDWEDSETPNKIKEIVGERVVPLILKMTEYVVGKNIPTE